jgi:hypothetical protein
LLGRVSGMQNLFFRKAYYGKWVMERRSIYGRINGYLLITLI